jgi:cold shock CspA family protein
MSEQIDKYPAADNINGLFVKEKKDTSTESIGNIIAGKTEDQPDEKEIISTIFSIKDGFGFIKDEENNNVFFYYNTVTNKDFDELEVGMKVAYLREEDSERTKRDEAPRYRAYKVSVMD